MGGRRATSQFERQEAKNDDDSLTHELRGIVINQTKGYNFIFFSNDMEAVYNRRATISKGFQELELGEHVYCLVRDTQVCNENGTPRCEILSYQTIPAPSGWGIAGTTDVGLARIICPLRFLHLSKGYSGRPYPIYYNELMENVHDCNRRTIRLGEKLDVELLKRLKVRAEVIRTRVPEWRGRNGLMVHVVLEREIVDLEEEPDEPIRRRAEPKSTPIQKKEPCQEYQTKGFIIKRWGLFLIVCLEDRRSAIIDTENFPYGVPDLGTFIECDVKMLNAPIIDQEMVYEWEVTNMGPIDRSDYESIVEKDTAYVFSRHLTFEGYRLVSKTRQAQFSHPFFGLICDRHGVIYSSPQPGDPIEAYIRAVCDGELRFQWIIIDPKANVDSPQKPLPRAAIAPLHFAEEYESESNLSTTSGTYSVHDVESKNSYGTNDEIKCINSRAIDRLASKSADLSINSRATDRSISNPADRERALSYEDLVTRAMDNPEIRDAILRADPDLFAHILSLNM